MSSERELWPEVYRALVLTMCVYACAAYQSACSRPPQQEDVRGATSRGTQKLPFDRQPRSNGISPTLSFVPSNTKIPEGTSLVVTLRNNVSSATAHAGDTFSAALDEPLVVDGRVIVGKGTLATGRVLEAKSSTSLLDPGYVRLVLVYLNVDERSIEIETSSIFAKAGPREEINVSAGIAASATHEDITFESGRHLYFRLAQSAELRNGDPLQVQSGATARH